MLYLSAAIVVLAISIVLAFRSLSRAIITAASMVAFALDVPRNAASPVPGPIRETSMPTPMTPDLQPRIGVSSSLDDMAEARLEIQKRVFDAPALRAVGGSVSERIGDQDIVGISNGISERVER